MRIQHNIAAMNSYRQLGGNNNMLSKNLEKLSSGYRINRAGDDAAGLAISEKMRAQIKGLETAQKNANDAISLVQTAEGALTEVHSMLNRMTELATQSANGTYDNDVDRENLQKEVEALKSEIDRISKSTNFNKINLLDGSLGMEGVDFKVSDDVTSVLAANEGAAFDEATINEAVVKGSKDAVASKQTFYMADKLQATYDAAAKKTTVTITFNDSKAGAAAATGTIKIELNAANAGDKKEADLEAIVNTIKNTTSGGTIADVGDAKITFAGSTNINDLAKFHENYEINYDKDTNVLTVNTKADKAGKQLGITAGITAENADDKEVMNQNIMLDKDNDGANANTELLGASAGINITGADATLGEYEVASAILEMAEANEEDSHGKVITVDGKKYVLNDIAAAEDKKLDLSKFGSDVTIVNYDSDETTKTNAGYREQALANAIAANAKDTGITATWNGASFIVQETAAHGEAVMKGEAKSHDMSKVLGTGDLTDTDKGNHQIILDKEMKVGTQLTIKNGTDATVFEFVKAGEKPLNEKAIAVTFTEGDEAANAAALADALKANGYEKASATDGVVDLGVDAEDSGLKLSGAGGGRAMQVGDTADDFNKVFVKVDAMDSKSLGIANINIETQEGASEAIEAIKNAINKVSSTRGDLGAVQNRLEHTINNLGVTTENITAAESRIRDTDMASEMMAYTKNNILIQASQAMLAQANQVPQGVLQLLQ